MNQKFLVRLNYEKSIRIPQTLYLPPPPKRGLNYGELND